jgi:hypothetical protein
MTAPESDCVGASVSRVILFVAAVVGFLAAVASAPAAPTDSRAVISPQIIKSPPADATPRDPGEGMRPLGRGPIIKVARAYDAEDEDCTLAITKRTDESGKVHVERGVACAN